MAVPPCDALRSRLWTRWRAVLPEAVGVGKELIERYGDHSRVYHDLRHLEDVLTGIDLLAGEAADARLVELAGWFHDAVYDIATGDNEAASADLARRLLAPYLDERGTQEVARLVLLTRDHAVAEGDRNGAVLCDADLAVLAGTGQAYDDYARRVRREYAAVPDGAFRSGRAEVLRGLLALPTIYSTELGRSRWEAAARGNLHRELDSLS